MTDLAEQNSPIESLLDGELVLEARSLSKDYRIGSRRLGTILSAVRDVSLELRRGTVVALVGESGSGKSTVAKLLAGQERPSAGEILLDGEPVHLSGRSAFRAHKAEVQMVFQDPFASLNPTHRISYPLRRAVRLHQREHDTAAVAAEMDRLLEEVRLTPPEQYLSRFPHELSGGQRQRVSLARALAARPRVLLADEPVSMLDVSIRLEILNLLDRLKRDRRLALLYVTHDLATARHFSSEIMVMYKGEIVERGPSDEVILHPSHPYTKILANAAPDPSASRSSLAAAREQRQSARAARTAEHREMATDTGCRFRTRCPFVLDICTQHPPDLEVGAGHLARCWLYSGTADGAAAAGSAAEAGRGQ